MQLYFKYSALALAILAVVCGSVWAITLLLRSPEPEAEPVIEEPGGLVPTAAYREVPMGTSVNGRAITAYEFGTGAKHVLFVGGVHGGYEWNSVLLAYGVIDEFIADPTLVPADLTVSVIPALNPDGVAAVIGTDGRFTAADVPSGTDQSVGRFNANGIDLNRNFGCKWAPESSWRGNVVSAGSEAFSEPEAAALRDYVAAFAPTGVVFWHSQANAVYASECHEGVLPSTIALMNTYATAANYKAVESFDAYPVTGDAEGWLASIGIPAITVELATHESIEWQKNWTGTQAVLQAYSQVGE